jgi:hypothetical protein
LVLRQFDQTSFDQIVDAGSDPVRGNPIEEPWLHFQTYLADHPSGIAVLRGSRTGASIDAFWLSMYGSPMTDNGIYGRIVARTRERLRQPINPHLFRDCAVTSLAIDDPANIGIASRLLGHRTGSTTERITTKRTVSKRAASCKHSFWRGGVTTFSVPTIHGHDPVMQQTTGAGGDPPTRALACGRRSLRLPPIFWCARV